MLKFYQQSKIHKSTFLVINEQQKATHFSINDGQIQPIKNLSQNVQNQYSEQSIPITPLALPVMNFGGKDEVANLSTKDGPLTIPTMNFGGKVKKETKKNEANEPLVIPRMF